MSKRYELLITGSFHKTVAVEAGSEEDALDRFWRGEEYETVSDWEFNEITYAEVDGCDEIVGEPAPRDGMFEVAYAQV